MRCYLGFLLCTLALAGTAIASAEDEPHFYAPVGQCPSIDGVHPVLLADSENRTIFYICSHGRPFPQRCPSDTVFDPNLPGCKNEYQVIDDEQVPTPYKPVGDCPEVDGKDPVYLPDSTNNTIFYECSNGIPNQLQCAPGLVFNPNSNVCVFPPNF